jgi:hypothetical protein
MQLKRSMGCAHHFWPTHNQANVGHPSIPSDDVVTQTPKGRRERVLNVPWVWSFGIGWVEGLEFLALYQGTTKVVPPLGQDDRG